MPKIGKPGGGHWMRNRKAEICIGLVLFAVGALLLFDAFDGRGKSMPWPVSTLAPW